MLFALVYFLPTNQQKNIQNHKTKNEGESIILKTNDKIIIVKNLKLEYLKKAIQQFCTLNKDIGKIINIKLTILTDQYVVTFPHDIDFDILCYFINYIEYAHELSLKLDYKPEVYCWYKTKNDDKWMTKDIINKEVLLYIPESDDEYDNVYLTTSDNLGFKMGFGLGYQNEKLPKPRMRYIERPIQISDLNGFDSINF